MSVKLYEGDKEVKFMTLGEVAKELNTTVVDIKALAKKTYLPIYEIAGGRISSGDLDFIKEKLNGNLDIEFTGCAVQMADDGKESREVFLDRTTYYDQKKELPTFNDFIKELKEYNEHDTDEQYAKYGDTYSSFMLDASSYLEKDGFLDCTEAGSIIGGTSGMVGKESRWILEKVDGNKYYFNWYSDWDPDFIPTHAYACMPKGQKDIDKLRLVELTIEDVDEDEVEDGFYDKIFKAVYIQDKEESSLKTGLNNMYKRYVKRYDWNDEDTKR